MYSFPLWELSEIKPENYHTVDVALYWDPCTCLGVLFAQKLFNFFVQVTNPYVFLQYITCSTDEIP